MSYSSFQSPGGSGFSTVTDQIDPYSRHRAYEKFGEELNEQDKKNYLQLADSAIHRRQGGSWNHLSQSAMHNSQRSYQSHSQPPPGTSSPFSEEFFRGESGFGGATDLFANEFYPTYQDYLTPQDAATTASAVYSDDPGHVFSPIPARNGTASTGPSEHASGDGDWVKNKEEARRHGYVDAEERNDAVAGTHMDGMEIMNLTQSVPTQSALAQYQSSSYALPNQQVFANDLAAMGTHFDFARNSNFGTEHNTNDSQANNGPHAPVVSHDDGMGMDLSMGPHVIADRHSSDKYEIGIAGSFPPTRGHRKPSVKLSTSPTQSSKGRFRASVGQNKSLDVPNPRRAGRGRRRSSGSVSSVQPLNRPLGSIPEAMEAGVYEDPAVIDVEDDPNVLSTSGRRPGRKRPYTEEQRQSVGQNRKKGDICINCVCSKTKCDQQFPCNRCEKSRKSIICEKAHWLDLVCKAPNHTAFQLALSTSHSGQGPFAGGYCSDLLPVAALLDFMDRLRPSQQIQVTCVTSATYRLDLDEFHAQLSRRASRLRTPKAEVELQDLFGVEKSDCVEAAKDWFRVVQDSGLSDTERLCRWTLIPREATYRLIWITGAKQGSRVNIYNSRDKEFAAMLSSIVLRAAEILGHQELQKDCNNLKQTTGNVEFAALDRNLRNTIGVLRLQHAWSLAHEAPSLGHIYNGTEAAYNAATILRILYYWSFKTREAAAKHVDRHNHDLDADEDSLRLANRIVNDPLPKLESNEGFQTWLQEGHRVLQDAGFAQNTYNTMSYEQQYPAHVSGHMPQSWVAQSAFPQEYPGASTYDPYSTNSFPFFP